MGIKHWQFNFFKIFIYLFICKVPLQLFFSIRHFCFLLGLCVASWFPESEMVLNASWVAAPFGGAARRRMLLLASAMDEKMQ